MVRDALSCVSIHLFRKEEKMGLSAIVSAVKNIINLPNVSSGSVPQLSTHIADAKACARKWLDTRSKPLATTLSAANTMCNQWEGAYKHQLDLLMESAYGNKARIKAILQEAQGETVQVEKNMSDISSQLISDDNEIIGIAGELVGDAQNISSQITADKTTMKDLQQRIAEAQAKIREYKDRQKWYWFGGPLFYLLAHEIDGLASNVSGYEDQIRAYQKSESQLEADSKSLSLAMSGVNNWVGAMKIASSSLSAVSEGADSLVGDLGNVIRKIDETNPATFGIWLKSQLISISKDYDQIGCLAGDLAR